MYKTIKSKKGFSLLEIMVVASVGLVVIAAITQVILNQTKASRRLEIQVEKISMLRTLTQIMSNGNCECFLNPVSSPANDPLNKRFDATKPDNPATDIDESTPIIFSEIKFGCSTVSPIFVKVGQPMLPGFPDVLVESIKLKNLQPIDGSPPYKKWKGTWSIFVDSKIGPAKPVTLDQIFIVNDDNSISPESNRLIKNCLSSNSPSGTLDSCASGFSLVGAVGSYSNFCISTSPESTVANFMLAVQNCLSRDTSGRGKMHLCSPQEFSQACSENGNPAISSILSGGEYLYDAYTTTIVAASRPGSCYQLNEAGINVPQSYRCCYR